MHDFESLDAFKLGHQLTLAVYAATAAFPEDERYGLVSQIRRASASVPTNIAEGAGRPSATDFARFVAIAVGSASEVIYQIRLADELGYLSQEDAKALISLASRSRLVAERLRQSLAGGASGASGSTS